MRVRAIEDGFYGDTRRRRGEVFEFHGKKLGSWMEPAEKPYVEPEPEAPYDTLSAINREQHKIEEEGVQRKRRA